MGEYKFYQDRKVTSWERDYFSVKANSCEEAFGERDGKRICQGDESMAVHGLHYYWLYGLWRFDGLCV